MVSRHDCAKGGTSSIPTHHQSAHIARGARRGCARSGAEARRSFGRGGAGGGPPRRRAGASGRRRAAYEQSLGSGPRASISRARTARGPRQSPAAGRADGPWCGDRLACPARALTSQGGGRAGRRTQRAARAAVQEVEGSWEGGVAFGGRRGAAPVRGSCAHLRSRGQDTPHGNPRPDRCRARGGRTCGPPRAVDGRELERLLGLGGGGAQRSGRGGAADCTATPGGATRV